MTPARKRVLEIAGDGLIRAKGALAAEGGCSTGVVDGLIAAGTLVEVAIPERRLPVPNPALRAQDLSDAQARAAETLRAAADAQAFSVTLLDGVTGSGKTEVYFEAVARTLEKGRQALIMLPEIALTSQFMDRFTRRFGCPPVEWHSALSSAERAQRLARRRHRGSARGGRRALGAVPALQGARPHRRRRGARHRLQAGGSRPLPGPRHGGGARAAWASLPVVLASATPSIESHVNARTGRYAQVDCRGATPAPSCRRCRPSTCASTRPSAASGSRRCWSRP